MDKIFIDKDGRKRKGDFKKCKCCNKDFLTRLDQPATFCSVECSGIGKRKQIQCKCSFCHENYTRPNSKANKSKSGFSFCSRSCKDKAQKIENGFNEMWPSHFNISTAKTRQPEFYRKFYKKEFSLDKLFCCRCGYCEFECGIDIHHKDGDFKNNCKDNLLSLCVPCHRAFHKKLWTF